MDLSLSIPRRASKITGYIDLSECLLDFIKKEKIDVDGYKCEKCKKDSKLSK
jgi:ubiquitin C-terminal hydrolase